MLTSLEADSNALTSDGELTKPKSSSRDTPSYETIFVIAYHVIGVPHKEITLGSQAVTARYKRSYTRTWSRVCTIAYVEARTSICILER